MSDGHTGIMIALIVPAQKAAGLALSASDLPQGSTPSPVEDLHLTLAYLGDIADATFSQDDLTTVVGAFARWQSSIQGQVSGVGRFLTDEGSDTNAFYASFDSPQLATFRASLVSELANARIPFESNHGFTPHITLAYIPSTAPTPVIDLAPMTLTFESVTLAWGDVRTNFALASDAPSYPMFTAEFSETAAINDDYIERTGLIFRAGEYPDKDFALTPDELAACAARFQPVPLDLEHVPTPLDGKLGHLTRVEARNNNHELWGTVRYPRWLDAALADTGRKVSSTFDRTTKDIRKLALVRTPRVTDAALMAAFGAAEGNTMADTNTKPNTPAALDQAWAAFSAEFSGATLNAENKKRVQTIHDASGAMGAQCATAQMSAETELTPREKAMVDRLAAQEAQFAQMQAERRHEQGVAFAKDYADRLTPHARGIVADFYAMFAEADTAGVATFNDGKQKSRISAFTEFLATLQKLPYTSEQIAGFSVVEHTGNTTDKNALATFDAETKEWALKMNGGTK